MNLSYAIHPPCGTDFDPPLELNGMLMKPAPLGLVMDPATFTQKIAEFMQGSAEYTADELYAISLRSVAAYRRGQRHLKLRQEIEDTD